MRRILGWLVVLALLAAPVAFAVAALEPAPLVAAAPEATPESAIATRNIVHRVRAVTDDQADPLLTVTPEEIEGAIAFASRLLRGLRGEAEIVPEGLRLRLSLPVPGWPALGWINAEAVVPPFEGGARLASARLGGIDLPPGLTLGLAEAAGNLVLGGGAGTKLRAAVPDLAVAPDHVTVRVVMDGTMRGAMTRRLARTVRGGEMPEAAEIRGYYLALRDALEAGLLPDQGSFLPYLRFTVEEAHRRAAPGREDHEFTAALFALTQLCGARDFRLVVGRLVEGVVPDDTTAWTRSCEQVGLAGRIDTRRHFITAAAIKAASTIRISFTIGEYKELVDTITGAGGFDFTDIVANASGIRFAETFMAAGRDEWPMLRDRLDEEADVLAGFDAIPGLMPRPEFERRFGDVESPQYRAMIAEIEGRIDALALHAGRLRPGG